MGRGPTRFGRLEAEKKAKIGSDLQKEIRSQIEAGRTGAQKSVLDIEKETAERTGKFATDRGQSEVELQEFRDRNRKAAEEFNRATGAANELRQEELGREKKFLKKRTREIQTRLERPGRSAALIGGRKSLIS